MSESTFNKRGREIHERLWARWRKVVDVSDCPHCGSWHRAGFGCPAPDDSVGPKVVARVAEAECLWCGEVFEFLPGHEDRFCSDACAENAQTYSNAPDRMPEDEV